MVTVVPLIEQTEGGVAVRVKTPVEFDVAVTVKLPPKAALVMPVGLVVRLVVGVISVTDAVAVTIVEIWGAAA